MSIKIKIDVQNEYVIKNKLNFVHLVVHKVN